MQIANQAVATINYVLTANDGKEIDRASDGEFAYLHGASNIIPGLEQALEGKSAGDTVQVTVEPADGYGEYHEEQVQQVPRNMFPEDADIEIGLQFHAESPAGDTIIVTVTAIEDNEVTVDGNHPLAGETLNFDVEVVDVRGATEEELEHGHVHSPDGCEH